MPGSSSDFDLPIYSYILKLPRPISILDVGAGSGKYGQIFHRREGVKVDALEVWPPYIKQFCLNQKYDYVWAADIRDFVWMGYTVVIFGDILEHLTVKDARRVLVSAMEYCDHILVTVPYLCKQGAAYENKFEIHIQDDLAPEIMAERYPDLELLEGNEKRGLYGWRNDQ